MTEVAFSFLLTAVGMIIGATPFGSQVGPLPGLLRLPDDIALLLLRPGSHWVAGNCDRSLRSEPNAATAHPHAVQRQGNRDAPPPSRHRRRLGNGICERRMERRAPPLRRGGGPPGGEPPPAQGCRECE